MIHRREFISGLIATGVVVPVVSPSGARGHARSVTTDEIGDQVQTLRKGEWPVFASTPELQRLYRFALERGDELRWMPCYCGCGDVGHRSNRDCYVKATNPDGTITFTSHAAT